MFVMAERHVTGGKSRRSIWRMITQSSNESDTVDDRPVNTPRRRMSRAWKADETAHDNSYHLRRMHTWRAGDTVSEKLNHTRRKSMSQSRMSIDIADEKRTSARRSQTWKTIPKMLTSLSLKPSSLTTSTQKLIKRRQFLTYAFIWTGATMEGFLVRVPDVDIDILYSFPIWPPVFEDYSAQLISATTRTISSMFISLLRFLGPHSRQDFEHKLNLHLRRLSSWRSTVRSGKETSFLLEDSRATFCLLENKSHGQSLKRDRFCELNAVNVIPFDFRPVGSMDNIARATSLKEGVHISCAAMIVLLEIQDAILGDFGVEDVVAELRAEIMELYDGRPGGRSALRAVQGGMLRILPNK